MPGTELTVRQGMYVSRHTTFMVANLNGPWATPKPMDQDAKIVVPTAVTITHHLHHNTT